ncbi:hypothetical protein HETIRDRAFT_332132 [Heterobasidion irregulare TC 32-1]|uniref:Peptidase S1 domain-containing protein n=1 Tax=Heterobasidion irregulare (strain TC 32-1) TaxID=747525 RepID=W4JM41_HETIT|nr:uncharacterized protein HETIRDRAFT_332132 [Heterobasidion irregulare TC 32-1]ETW74622.1 hypothetical protein HETIRDRAFT_332132 [Heterobasidion irregulare TC 32-1]
MAANEDRLLPLRITFTRTPPNLVPNAPFIPSAEEAEHRYYGIPSQPYFIARSSHDTWAMPTGMDAYIQPRELHGVGKHPLCDVWEDDISVAMHNYMVEQEVQYSSLDPVRIKIINEPISPVIIWVGVEPGSLSAERFLLKNGIEDVHVEIRASVISTFAKMYKPVPTSNPTVHVREAFSTALGITICAEKTPNIQGTATLFFTVSSKPGKLFLLTAKHVLFRVDEENDHYEYHRSGPRRNVLLMGADGFKARIQDIEKEIGGTHIVIAHLRARLKVADKMEDLDDAQAEREDIQPQLDKAEKAVKQLKLFLADLKRDWEDPKSRIIGHVVLSPPLIHSVGKDGFTQDIAIIEVDTTKIDATNFIGNVIDLGTEIPVKTLTAWMHPNPANQPSFEYPPNRLLQFRGTLSNDEMCKPNPKNIDDRGDPTIMVFKRGCSSGLTVGCLNNICSVVRKAIKTKPGVFSKEVAVLPRTSKSGAFSEGGDSGAAVINGRGAVAGMLTGGGGSGKVSDCTYVTPITFLLERLKELCFPANIFPTAADVFD